MRRAYFVLLWMLVVAVFGGCASRGLSRAEAPVANKTLVGSGYADLSKGDSFQFKQHWLNAQQFAKLNAYRGLADQLYYEPVGDQKTVGSQVVGHEAYRVYLDTYLRQAKASDYRTVKDTLQATMTLELTPRFYRCMGGELAEVRQCLREDGKLAITRLGQKKALTTSANLACTNRDCSDQFFVQGFSKDRNPVDDLMLDAGLYDMEWTANAAARALFNQYLIDEFLTVILFQGVVIDAP